MSIYNKSIKLAKFIKSLGADIKTNDKDAVSLEYLLRDVIEESTFQGDEVLEDFDGFENLSTSFTSGDRLFTITGEGPEYDRGIFNNPSFPYGYDGSTGWINYVADNPSDLDQRYICINLLKSKIKLRSIWAYYSQSAGEAPIASPSFIKVTLYLRGAEVFTKQYDVGTTGASNNSFSEIDITSDYDGYCDKIKFNLLADNKYLALDHMTFIK